MPASIGFFGGSFDPVHEAHLAVAQAAMQVAGLSQVYWLLAACSPLKAHQPIATDAQRLAMLELALADNPAFSILDWELVRGGPSYTIDSVEKARTLWPNAELYWILGEDQWCLLPHWHRIEMLAQYVTFLVYKRPQTPSLTHFSIPNLRYRTIPGPLFSTSSTLIRETLRLGQTLEVGLPASIRDYARAVYANT